jgi:membrane protein
MMIALMIVSLVEVAERSRFGAIVSSIRGLYVLQTLSFQYLGTLLVILAVGLIFYFIPNAKTRFRDVWVGAILTGALWRLAFDGFSWYLGRNMQMRMIHGSVAAILGFLLWIYVSSIILMYGVEFTASYARMRRRRPDDVPAAQSPRV